MTVSSSEILKTNLAEKMKSAGSENDPPIADETKQEADTTLGIGRSKESNEMNKGVAGSTPQVRRYLLVHGDAGKANDVIYAPPLEKEYVSTEVESSTPDPHQDRVMVFFGGDIQDFPEVMETCIQKREHTQWNLENTAILLRNQFPDRHILVVRPRRQYDQIYSCFDNFLPTAIYGNPEHTPYHGALLHLERLLIELSRRINQDRHEDSGIGKEKVISSTSSWKAREKGVPEGNSTSRPVNFARGDISLVGFSKGCVVLNQLLYEFHYLKTLTPDDKSFEDFLCSIHDMYWLDGGHSGGKNTWIVSRGLLETLTRLKINIHVHVTPYQICDEVRPHIRREEKLFSVCLKNCGASIQRYVHYESLPSSLSRHFDLLAEFGSPSVRNGFDGEEWEIDRDQGNKSLVGNNNRLDDLKLGSDNERDDVGK